MGERGDRWTPEEIDFAFNIFVVCDHAERFAKVFTGIAMHLNRSRTGDLFDGDMVQRKLWGVAIGYNGEAYTRTADRQPRAAGKRTEAEAWLIKEALLSNSKEKTPFSVERLAEITQLPADRVLACAREFNPTYGRRGMIS